MLGPSKIIIELLRYDSIKKKTKKQTKLLVERFWKILFFI